MSNLSKIQKDVLKLMASGWELGSTCGGRGPYIHDLQKGGQGKGGQTKKVNANTIDSLHKNKLIISKYGFPTSTYSLTYLGKQIAKELD